MHGKKFSLHTRKPKKGKPVYYFQTRLPNGKWSTALSTGQTSHGEAERWVREYLNNGQPIHKKNITLSDFAGNDFFTYGSKWELNKRITAKKKPSPRWCMERGIMLKNHIMPALGNYRLVLITKEEITRFRNDLFNAGYSGAYINKILFSLRDILQTALDEKKIQSMPEFVLAAVDEKKRGRLTRQEVMQIFSFDWSDERAYIASLLSAITGARLSEIQALRIDDIHPDGALFICRAWDRYTHTVKNRTKSGPGRPAPIPKTHLARILRYIETHPFKESNGFLIYSDKSGIPASDTLIMRPFHRALERIGLNKQERQKRGICYHSWRYYANSALIESGQPSAVVRERIGHTSDEMTQRYFRSENSERIIEAVEESVPLPSIDEIPAGAAGEKIN